MKTRAAVCYEAGKPLVIETVDLDGPKAGEVLVEIKATGICHTDEFTRSGDDPEGLAQVGNITDAAAKGKFPNWRDPIAANDGYVFTAPVGKFRPMSRPKTGEDWARALPIT